MKDMNHRDTGTQSKAFVLASLQTLYAAVPLWRQSLQTKKDEGNNHRDTEVAEKSACSHSFPDVPCRYGWGILD